MEVSDQLHAPAALSGERAPSTHRIRGWVGPGLDKVEKRKFLTLPGLELRPSVVQPVVSCYTDCAIPAPRRWTTHMKGTVESSIYEYNNIEDASSPVGDVVTSSLQSY
jgi:hypothetical protein